MEEHTVLLLDPLAIDGHAVEGHGGFCKVEFLRAGVIHIPAVEDVLLGELLIGRVGERIEVIGAALGVGGQRSLIGDVGHCLGQTGHSIGGHFFLLAVDELADHEVQDIGFALIAELNAARRRNRLLINITGMISCISVLDLNGNAVIQPFCPAVC